RNLDRRPARPAGKGTLALARHAGTRSLSRRRRPASLAAPRFGGPGAARSFPSPRTRFALMKKILFPVLAIGWIVPLQAEPLSRPVLERYEQMLLGAPEAGTPF